MKGLPAACVFIEDRGIDKAQKEAMGREEVLVAKQGQSDTQALFFFFFKELHKSLQ